MFLLLILPILISGYIAFKKNPYHYYRLHRYEGQLLYLESVRLGLLCTLSSSFFTFIFNRYVPSHVELFNSIIPLDVFAVLNVLVKDIAGNNSKDFTWILIITIGSLIISYIYAWGAKLKLFVRAWDPVDALSLRRIGLSIKRKKWLLRDNSSSLSLSEKSKIILMYSILKDSPIDDLFFNSYIKDGYFIMLTMEDRKVYIGRVISLGEPNETEGMDQEIAITPYVSGYRDKDDLSLKLTTMYSEVSEDVTLVLRQDKIMSATHFSDSIYEEFKKNNKSKSSIQGAAESSEE